MRITKITFLLALCGVFLCGQYSFAGCVDRDTDLSNSTGCDNSQCDNSCGSTRVKVNVDATGLADLPAIGPAFESLHVRFASLAIPKFNEIVSTPVELLMQGLEQELLPSPNLKKNLTGRG